MPFTNIILFKCPSCTRVARTPIPPCEVSWFLEPTLRNTTIECDSCKASFNITVRPSDYRLKVELVGYPAVEVFSSRLTELADPHDALADRDGAGPTDDPLFEFLSSYSHMTEVLHTYGIGSSGLLKSSAPEINKLVLSGLISAMEAYLANTLMSLVAEETEATENLLLKEEKLSSQKITLFQAWSESLTVERRVQDYLRDQIYHRLGQVERLYEIAFNIQIFPSLEVKQSLHRSVELRHDIVHRNGIDRYGQEQDFSSVSVFAMMRDIRDFVMHINNQLFKALIEVHEEGLRDGEREGGVNSCTLISLP